MHLLNLELPFRQEFEVLSNAVNMFYAEMPVAKLSVVRRNTQF